MKKNTTIMMVEPLGDGGIAHYTFNLLEALVNGAGISACLFTASEYELQEHNRSFQVFPNMFRLASFFIKRYVHLSSELPFPSIIRRGLKIIEYPLNSFEAMLFAKKKNVHTVHIQSVNYADIITVMIAHLFHFPVILTVHNVMPWHRQLKNYQRIVISIMYKMCNKIIIHSHEGKDRLVEIYNIDPEKVVVMAHGDYKFFLPEKLLKKKEAKKKIGVPINSKTILFFGAIRRNKGLDDLLMALVKIKYKIPKSLLLIVGEPCEDYSKYSKIIDQYNLRDMIFERLTYIPNKDVADYFFASDVVVLPYKEITQSGVLQIAYAFEKPVVATDIGGFSEAIENGRNGFLVNAGDHETFAEKTIEILSDEQKMTAMGRHSGYLSNNKYSWNTIAKKTNEVYQSLT